MAYVGHVWRARPGRIDDYRRFHATVWPELERLLEEAGITTYVIYAWDDILFSHMEVKDYERMVERFNGDPVAERWEEEVGELIEYPDADPETGWPRMLEQVWVLTATAVSRSSR